MTADDVFRRLHLAGVRLELQGDRLNASPAARLTDDLRVLIRNNKPSLVAYLIDAHQTSVQLIEAAMMACDRHGDGPDAREQMRRECNDTPQHLRASLCDHFKKTYRGKP